MYNLLKGIIYFWEFSCLWYEGWYRSTSTISHGVST